MHAFPSATSSNRSPSPPQQDCYQINFYRNGELVAEPKHDPVLSRFSWVGTGRWADRTFSQLEICDVFRDLCIALNQHIDCPIIMPEKAISSGGSALARGPFNFNDTPPIGRRERSYYFDDDRELLSYSPQVSNSAQDYPDLLL